MDRRTEGQTDRARCATANSRKVYEIRKQEMNERMSQKTKKERRDKPHSGRI